MGCGGSKQSPTSIVPEPTNTSNHDPDLAIAKVTNDENPHNKSEQNSDGKHMKKNSMEIKNDENRKSSIAQNNQIKPNSSDSDLETKPIPDEQEEEQNPAHNPNDEAEEEEEESEYDDDEHHDRFTKKKKKRQPSLFGQSASIQDNSSKNY